MRMLRKLYRSTIAFPSKKCCDVVLWVGYFCWIIDSCACNSKPLLEPTSNGRPWEWMEVCQQAFWALKQKLGKLACKPVLAMADLPPRKPFNGSV